MTSTTGYEYWFIRLPAGAKERGRSQEERITDELSELAGRGWEPVCFQPIGLDAHFVLRKASA